MRKGWMVGLGATLLVGAALVGVGAGAYRLGEQRALDDDREVVVGEVIVGDAETGQTIVIDGQRGWRGRGFFPGSLVFPLVLGGIALLIASRGRPGGHGWPPSEDRLDEWHRKAHAADAGRRLTGG